LSSHILIRCLPGKCNRVEKYPQAEEVHAQLIAGANFEELVLAHSQDTGTKSKNGLFDKWIKIGEPRVSPPYVGGVFSIAKTGEYSAVVETQFGFHIIRLDGLHEAYYKSYEEVEETIIAALEGEYRKMSAKEFEARYRMSDQTHMDAAVLEEIFAPYRTTASETQARPDLSAPAVSLDAATATPQ
jgi:parvulin-like peptidyl-prolyl isomerase